MLKKGWSSVAAVVGPKNISPASSVPCALVIGLWSSPLYTIPPRLGRPRHVVVWRVRLLTPTSCHQAVLDMRGETVWGLLHHFASRCHESERGHGAQVPGGTPTAGTTSLRQGRSGATVSSSCPDATPRPRSVGSKSQRRGRNTPRAGCAARARRPAVQPTGRAVQPAGRGGDAEPRPACWAVIRCAQGLCLQVRHRPVTLARRARGCVFQNRSTTGPGQLGSTGPSSSERRTIGWPRHEVTLGGDPASQVSLGHLFAGSTGDPLWKYLDPGCCKRCVPKTVRPTNGGTCPRLESS